MNKLSTYGVVADDAGGKGAAHEADGEVLAEIRFRGFAALPSVLEPSEVAMLNGQMDEIYARQCHDAGGEQNLIAMNDADIARCLLAYSDDYMGLAQHPRLIAIARAILGDNFVLLMQNGVVNRPDRRQFQTSWHRDLNYQHWVCSRILAISALVCLEDFSRETGGTTFLPGSHRFEDFPADEIVDRFQETPVLPAGSMIIFDSMVFHRAGVNRSGRIRRAVNHVLGAPILAQQIDIPSMLDRSPPADPWLAGYLGYKWNPKASVTGWRLQRITQAMAATSAVEAGASKSSVSRPPYG